jgi:hypothetical protein
MKSSDLPENASERKAIVFMEDHEYEMARLDKTNKWIKDPNICILEYPDEELSEDYPVLKNDLYIKLKNKGLISLSRPGILVQNPYDPNDYSIVSSDNEEKSLIGLFCSNALYKYDVFSELCQALGATKVVYKQIKSDSKISSTKANAKVGYKPVFSDFNLDLQNKIKEAFSVNAKGSFAGSDSPDIEAAKKILDSHNLGDDKHLKSLIRKSSAKNKLGKEEIVLDVTSDSMASLNIAINIKFALFNAKGNFSRTVKDIETMHIEYLVEFDKG